MITPTKYQQTQVMTASPMELIVMMYDECITTLEKAEKSFEHVSDGPDRIQALNNTLLHAEDIISELAISLDMERGGEIAKNLHRLYDFMIYYLSQANTKQILKPIVEVRKMMVELRQSWQKVAIQEPAREEDAENVPLRGGILVNG